MGSDAMPFATSISAAEYRRLVSACRPRQHPERELQCGVAEYLRWRAFPDAWWSHFPAGEVRDAATGALLQRMGMKAGTPDVLLLRGGKLHGLELKAGDRGRLSAAQVAAHAELRRAGAVVGVARSMDEALGLLREWSVIPAV
jgi:hypothetical protein